jgi:hypothetical protein
MVRPFLRSATALCVYTAVSGRVPASVHDGDNSGLWLDGGDELNLIVFYNF